MNYCSMNRHLTLTFFVALVLQVSGQEPVTVHRFTCRAELVGAAEKLIVTEMKALDNEARISVDDRSLKIAIRSSITQGEVWSGVQRSRACDPDPVRGEGRSDVGPGGPMNFLTFPKYHATGDPLSDDAAYEEAKRLWIAAHPAEYEQLQIDTPE